jgi:hypothetical protein
MTRAYKPTHSVQRVASTVRAPLAGSSRIASIGQTSSQQPQLMHSSVIRMLTPRNIGSTSAPVNELYRLRFYMKLFRHFDELPRASLAAQGECFQMSQVSTGPCRIVFASLVKNGETLEYPPVIM